MPKMAVVSDLLDMFVRHEEYCLTNQIVNSITRTRTLEDVLVIVSFTFVGTKYPIQLNKEICL